MVILIYWYIKAPWWNKLADIRENQLSHGLYLKS